MKKKKGILPSPGYPPGKPGVAIRRLKQLDPTVTFRSTPRRLRRLKYNDQLPLPHFD